MWRTPMVIELARRGIIMTVGARARPRRAISLDQIGPNPRIAGNLGVTRGDIFRRLLREELHSSVEDRSPREVVRGAHAEKAEEGDSNDVSETAIRHRRRRRRTSKARRQK